MFCMDQWRALLCELENMCSKKTGQFTPVTRNTDSAACRKIQNVHKLLVGVITLKKTLPKTAVFKSILYLHFQVSLWYQDFFQNKF